MTRGQVPIHIFSYSLASNYNCRESLCSIEQFWARLSFIIFSTSLYWRIEEERKAYWHAYVMSWGKARGQFASMWNVLICEISYKLWILQIVKQPTNFWHAGKFISRVPPNCDFILLYSSHKIFYYNFCK